MRMTSGGGTFSPEATTSHTTKFSTTSATVAVMASRLTEEFILTLTPEQQEMADQINRRTEFKVLRTNYNLF